MATRIPCGYRDSWHARCRCAGTERLQHSRCLLRARTVCFLVVRAAAGLSVHSESYADMRGARSAGDGVRGPSAAGRCGFDFRLGYTCSAHTTYPSYVCAPSRVYRCLCLSTAGAPPREQGQPHRAPAGTARRSGRRGVRVCGLAAHMLTAASGSARAPQRAQQDDPLYLIYNYISELRGERCSLGVPTH